MKNLFVFLVAAAASAQNAPDHPSITAQGKTFTPRSILARNMGTPEDQTTAFPPHRIIGNIYYVGTKTLSSFLIVTPMGNILLDSTYERNVPTIRRSIEQALEACAGRIYGTTGAAARLGLQPSTLQGKMQKLGIARMKFVRS